MILSTYIPQTAFSPDQNPGCLVGVLRWKIVWRMKPESCDVSFFKSDFTALTSFNLALTASAAADANPTTAPMSIITTERIETPDVQKHQMNWSSKSGNGKCGLEQSARIIMLRTRKSVILVCTFDSVLTRQAQQTILCAVCDMMPSPSCDSVRHGRWARLETRLGTTASMALSGATHHFSQRPPVSIQSPDGCPGD